MLDDATPTSAPGPRCMWCSAVLPSDHETTCPSCGATLVGEGEAAVPGLTAIDADAILRNARSASRPRPRGGRILSWISGEYPGDEGAAASPPGSLAPPPAEVRREMLRLELEAQVANAQAEVEALAADAAIDGGRPLGELPGLTVPLVAVEATDAPAAPADDVAPAPGDTATPPA
jgi:hypothetical protein